MAVNLKDHISSKTNKTLLHLLIRARTKVQFETFDSSMDEKRDEKLVFKYIQRMEPHELKAHLENNRDRMDVTNIYDRSGYSPLHFAAYKNSDKLCEVLCEFILKRYRYR